MTFSTREMKYIWYLPKKSIFFYFILFLAKCNVSPLKKKVLKMQKTKILANTNNFGTKIFVTF